MIKIITYNKNMLWLCWQNFKDEMNLLIFHFILYRLVVIYITYTLYIIIGFIISFKKSQAREKNLTTPSEMEAFFAPFITLFSTDKQGIIYIPTYIWISGDEDILKNIESDNTEKNIFHEENDPYYGDENGSEVDKDLDDSFVEAPKTWNNPTRFVFDLTRFVKDYEKWDNDSIILFLILGPYIPPHLFDIIVEYLDIKDEDLDNFEVQSQIHFNYHTLKSQYSQYMRIKTRKLVKNFQLGVAFGCGLPKITSRPATDYPGLAGEVVLVTRTYKDKRQHWLLIVKDVRVQVKASNENINEILNKSLNKTKWFSISSKWLKLVFKK